MSVTIIPPSDHLVRHIPFAALAKDEDGNTSDAAGNPYGVTAFAFQTKPLDEGELSTAWCEFFDGTPAQALECAIGDLRASRTLGSKSGFAVASVGDITHFMRDHDRSVRVVHDPQTGFDSHSVVKRWPSPDELLLLENIATTVWRETVLMSSLTVALAQCERSAKGEDAMRGR